ncbi:hypothetical protein E4V99_06285 [Microbacterium sp. dk485]|uniref:hypothetical protein n=1 Tax=Microbacterium sp. dk485 TaxID=2560021 RepID=UPI001073FBB9|nr:hypothetical protein [Microbacterium sp. dk485]TFV84655.1 hypothetical protein E4V99_06285 [Microbacterium sp. dk485]
MPQSVRAVASVLPPQFRFMGALYVCGFVITGFLSFGIAFAPLAAGEPAQPRWIMLPFGFLIVAIVLSVVVLRHRGLKDAAEAQVERDGGRVYLLSAAAISKQLGPKNLIAQLDHRASGGWLWLGEDSLKVWIRDAGEVRVVPAGDLTGVAEVHVLGGVLTDTQLAVWFSDGSVLEAVPTRYGIRSMFPYGRSRLRALADRIDALPSSRPADGFSR